MRDRRVALFVIAGLLAGWLVGPRVAGAVGTLVTIQNSAGTQKAGVTKAQQLQTAESAPPTFREFRTAGSGGTCLVAATVPSSKGFVLRTLVVSVNDDTTGGLDVVLVYPNGTCDGADFMSVSTLNPGSTTLNVEPGFAVAAGGKLSVRFATTSSTGLYLFGYLVPKGDVPSTTPLG